MMSLFGWIIYGKTGYSWILCLISLGIVNGLATQLARIVKVEKFMDPTMVFYAYLTRPILATLFGWLLLPNIFLLPSIYNLIGGAI